MGKYFNHTPETIAKIKAARAKQTPPIPKGAKFSEEHKAKLKEAWERRKANTPSPAMLREEIVQLKELLHANTINLS